MKSVLRTAKRLSVRSAGKRSWRSQRADQATIRTMTRRVSVSVRNDFYYIYIRKSNLTLEKFLVGTLEVALRTGKGNPGLHFILDFGSPFFFVVELAELVP